MSQASIPSSIPDLDARVRALDPGTSFIVQAPAGSGKTELLIQRYLVLLATVDEPEEISAITFTRKSAAEMRQRVLAALAAARDEPRPEEAHRALTWDHARRALARDAQRGWSIATHVARLRIQTIDALCVSLTRQMPVLSALGAQPDTIDDASLLYREAALATMALVDEPGHAAAEDVATLLTHLDNQFETALGLLCDMLARRDQWMRLGRDLPRDVLEGALEAERELAVARVEAIYQPPGVRGVEAWQQHAQELLTQKGTWRKKSAEAKALEVREDAETLRELLHALRRLPPAHYEDAQWTVMGAMVRLLPWAAAQLRLVFAARGEADFVEIAQRANAALGEADAPTDLLLALDHRIRHLLVDEFQDTSFTQFELLERLTAGWEPGDGRTLFLVGDPMQSIYRFREAEVSLFLQAQAHGLGGVSLEPLALSANFRSEAPVVEWVNRAFPRILPGEGSAGDGAVPYAPSHAVRPAASAGAGVQLHAFFNGDAIGEARQVAALARAAQARDPRGSIAVLVRNRAHLDRIVPALRDAGLRLRAIEIEALRHRQAVQDLLSLTRALSHLADRSAWLAVLRAPWCGLRLSDLESLVAVPTTEAVIVRPPEAADLFPETLAGAAAAAQRTLRTAPRLVLELLRDDSVLARLSTDARTRIARALPILEGAVAQRLRTSLRERVEGAWMELGGPACLTDDTDLEDAEVYFDFLERHEQAGELVDAAGFESALARLFALPDLGAGPSDVQLLTIHKAKGLEFDTVIVPGLGSPPRRADSPLLAWCERPGEAGGGRLLRSRLLMAPIRAAGVKEDPIFDYVSRLERRKDAHEDARLLYVAATRARRELHLLGDVSAFEAQGGWQMKEPPARSLLETLWPVVAGRFAECLALSPPIVEEQEGARAVRDQRLRRLPLAWSAPPAPPALAWPGAAIAAVHDAIEFSWAGETARRVGTVVHRWLQRIAEEGLEAWSVQRVRAIAPQVRVALAAEGMARAEVEAAALRVIAALEQAIGDERGRWALAGRPDARAELRVWTGIDGRAALLVMDRVFTEAGTRWIVDYKTSRHEGADRESFLDRERERYREQLERYARVLQALEGPSPTSLGLYFPLLNGWRDWTPPADR